MFEIYDVAIIPLIMAVVELFKKVGLPAKYSPFLAIALGLIVAFLYLNVTIKEAILVGFMIGLSASGLYSGSKNLVEKKEEKE